jgi:SAM-dependent methyltransferase
MTDGQQSAHGAKYAYTNRYWPEFYDLWVKQLFGSDLEKYDAFYWNLVLPFLVQNNAQSNEPLRIVDVGTGTGRVIQGILSGLKKHDNPTGSQIHIIGVDHSQEMLNRAEQLLASEARPLVEVSWLKTSAADLVDENPDLRGAVDLITFAAGSIGHLTAEGEREAFLGQVAGALRKTGSSLTGARPVAAISILAETDDSDQKQDDGVEFGGELRVRSLEWPILEYRKSATTRTVDKSKGVVVEDFSTEVVDVESETVVYAQDYSWSLKIFDQDAWEREVSRSGLRIAQKLGQGVETWYMLQLVN